MNIVERKTIDDLTTLYVDNCMSTIAIAKKFTCSTSTVYRQLDKYKIPIRPRSAAQRLRYATTITINSS